MEIKVIEEMYILMEEILDGRDGRKLLMKIIKLEYAEIMDKPKDNYRIHKKK